MTWAALGNGSPTQKQTRESETIRDKQKCFLCLIFHRARGDLRFHEVIHVFQVRHTSSTYVVSLIATLIGHPAASDYCAIAAVRHRNSDAHPSDEVPLPESALRDRGLSYIRRATRRGASAMLLWR